MDIKQIINNYGQSRLARRYGLSRQVVNNWVRRGKVPAYALKRWPTLRKMFNVKVSSGAQTPAKTAAGSPSAAP